jgi:Uma2 family endonuclease
MSTATAPRPMTVEELDALPDDGMERELIRGELRERPRTRRNRRHSRAEIKIGKALDLWLDAHADRGGEVVGGEAGFILRRDPDTNVGIDVAYVSAEVAARRPEAPDFEGPPVLAVEIRSPSDTQEAVDEKVTLDLESGVAVIHRLPAGLTRAGRLERTGARRRAGAGRGFAWRLIGCSPEEGVGGPCSPIRGALRSIKPLSPTMAVGRALGNVAASSCLRPTHPRACSSGRATPLTRRRGEGCSTCTPR